MTLTTIIAYCGALFIAAAIPGPGMTAIVGADGEGSVEGQLHVAGTRGFGAGG